MIDDYDLRFAINTETSGRVCLFHFRNPQDAEGVQINLTPREAERLRRALDEPGFHTITRDDAPDLQLVLELAA